MDRKWMLALWGGLFIVCAALGFVPAPTGALSFFMALLSLVFFAPPLVLLVRAKQSGDCATAALVRNLSAASLALTLLALVGNVLSLLGGVTLGNVMNVVLAIVSTPMYCGQIWILPLFCWAFLMVGANMLLKKMQ